MAPLPNLSKLGFGLSSIAGSGNFSHQQRLVKTAIDCGITHFDGAPYYGSGDAEKILGDVLATCPQEVTITTKFGLVAFDAGATGSFLRSALRPVLRRTGALKRVLSSVISRNHQPQKKYETGALIASIDTSINKIRRPITIFLLHDPDLDLTRNMDVVDELNEVRTTGRTKLTGLSGPAGIVQTSIHLNVDTYNVAQLENSLTCPAPVFELSKFGAGVITHRSIQGGLSRLIFLLEKRPGFSSIWSHELGIDPSNKELLAQVLIELALTENPDGTVLFSTTNPDRIKSIASVISSPILGRDGCVHLRKLFDDVNIKSGSVLL